MKAVNTEHTKRTITAQGKLPTQKETRYCIRDHNKKPCMREAKQSGSAVASSNVKKGNANITLLKQRPHLTVAIRHEATYSIY